MFGVGVGGSYSIGDLKWFSMKIAGTIETEATERKTKTTKKRRM